MKHLPNCQSTGAVVRGYNFIHRLKKNIVPIPAYRFKRIFMYYL